MKKKIKHTNLKLYKNVVYTSLTRYLIILLVGFFSSNALATFKLLPDCDGDHELQYNQLHQKITNNPDVTSDIYIKLAHSAICLEKEQEGIEYIKKAESLGHILAPYALGMLNLTYLFTSDDDQITALNTGIKRIEKSAQMIESLPHYPEGTTKDIPDFESKLNASTVIFAALPALYILQYDINLTDTIYRTDSATPNSNDDAVNILRKNAEKIAKNRSLRLGFLNKAQQAAERCLARPALDIWREKKETVYKSQQYICNILLNLTKMLHSMEQQIAEVSNSCTVPLNECEDYRRVINIIIKLLNEHSLYIENELE